jgi:dynactin-2
MADPKYVDLPGIAHDQPDVFETNDLPESDQAYGSEFDPTSDSVETIHITANEAFGKFRGKNVECDNIDFSDRIRRSKRQGYITWTGEYQVDTASSQVKETPLQKYQRLNCEVRELLDEIDSAITQEDGNSQSMTGLARQATQLQEQLMAHKLEESLGSDLIKRLEDPRSAAKEQLMNQLDALKNTPADHSNNNKAGSGTVTNKEKASNPAMYELLMKPEIAKLEEQKKISEIDTRLKNLEILLASSFDKVSCMATETNQKSVVGSIEVLTSKLSLLDQSHLDHVEGRLAALAQKMNAISEKKSLVEDAEKQNKIGELYELCNKTEANSVALPELLDRLDALQLLHEKALGFSKAMAQLDTVQQKLDENLSNNQKLLRETQTKFSENLSNIQNNFNHIEKKLAKL